MEHNNRARTTVYIEVQEFQPTSQQPPLYLPSPMDASNRVPGTLFYSAALPTFSPPPAPRYFPTSATTLYPPSPTYSPPSPQWVPTFPATFGPGSLSFAPGSPPYTPESPKWQPTTPTHNPVSPDWVPSSYTPLPMSPAYTPSSPKWAPTSPAGPPASPIGPPQSPEWMPREASPVTYCPTSPGPVPPSPPYIPRSSEWVSTASPANYHPSSPGPVPPSPPYIPRSSEWVSTASPAYYHPSSPGPVPPSPPYIPRSPKRVPTSPPPVPLSPSSPATTDPFAELERELDGWWGRGRFVYNRARSIVPEEEEQGQRGERETSTEPFPDLPDWEEAENAERDAEEDVQVQEATAAVPEEDLPDYEYYEQLDREEKGDAESNAEEDVQGDQVQEPIAAVPEEDDSRPINPFAFTSGHPSTFPWIRSNPFPTTPSVSTREPELSEDLPDNEYYEELDHETEAEALMQLETQKSVDNPYPAMAALNCVPQTEPHSNPYPSSTAISPSTSKIFTGYDAKEEYTDCLFRPSFRTSSTISSSFYRVCQKPIGRVKVEKRIDRVMWNRLMRKKISLMMEVCEKYAPADVLKGMKLDR